METILHGLGRNVSPIDKHDYPLRLYIPHFEDLQKLKDLRGSSYIWPFNATSLDQGKYGHCVGFGGADWEINMPVEDVCTNQDGHDLYYLCKIEDGEPGEENGSTVRSIAKVLQNKGRLKNYAWAASVDEITYWLLKPDGGPVIVGVDWYYGMSTPDKNNIIHPTGGIAGGHCFLINGWINSDKEYYQFQNSWGPGWGVNGSALISVSDFAKLLEGQGEAMTAVEEPLGPIPPTPDPNPGCLKSVLKILGLSV
jgi:hypothetical protein